MATLVATSPLRMPSNTPDDELFDISSLHAKFSACNPFDTGSDDEELLPEDAPDYYNSTEEKKIPEGQRLVIHIPEKTTSPFANKIFKEPVDINLVDNLLHGSLIDEDLRKKMYTYRATIKNGKAHVKYKQSNDFTFGRFNPVQGAGLHNISRRIRHTLAQGRYVDVDMKNCHPVLLLQILEANNYEGPVNCLSRYISNRDDVFAIIINDYHLHDHPRGRDAAKSLVLQTCFSGHGSKWREEYGVASDNDCLFIKELQKEIKYIENFIVHNNPALFDICKKHNIAKNKNYNHGATTLAHFLQTKENMILECIYNYCKDKQYIIGDVCALCNDGIMLEKHLYHDGIPAEFNEAVLEHLGLDVAFEVKPFDEAYSIEECNRARYFNNWKQDILDSDYATFFCELYGHDFVVKGMLDNKQLPYKFNGVTWIKDESKTNLIINDSIVNEFSPYIEGRVNKVQKTIDGFIEQYALLESHEAKDNLLEKAIKALGATVVEATTKKQKEMHKCQLYLETCALRLSCYLREIKRYLKINNKRQGLVKEIIRHLCCTTGHVEFDQRPNFFAFNNKIKNLYTGEWVEHNRFLYVSKTTGYDWCEPTPQARTKMQKILREIFPDKEVRDYSLVCLSTGLEGRQLPYLFICTGAGGNGKTFLFELLSFSIGDYAYKLPSEALLKPLGMQANPAIALMHLMRFVYAEEPKKGEKLVTSTITELTGGTTLNTRVCHSNEVTQTLLLTMFLLCNTIPLLDDTGDHTERRVKVIPFSSSFKDAEKFARIPGTEAEKNAKNIYKADSEYKLSSFKLFHRCALLEILFESFMTYKNENFQLPKQPLAVCQATQAHQQDSDEIYSWFSEHYERIEYDDIATDNIIKLKDLYTIFKVEYKDVWEAADRPKAKTFLASFKKNKLDTMLNERYFERDEYYPIPGHSKQQAKSPLLLGFKERDDQEEYEHKGNQEEPPTVRRRSLFV